MGSLGSTTQTPDEKQWWGRRNASPTALLGRYEDLRPCYCRKGKLMPNVPSLFAMVLEAFVSHFSVHPVGVSLYGVHLF